MIENERQYRITKAQAEKFAQAVELARSEAGDERVHPLLRAAMREAVESQLDTLRAELAEYEEGREESEGE